MSLRLSEKWFRRALWLIAILFAFFLIRLGGLIVSDLPMIAPAPSLESFMDPREATRVKAAIALAQTAIRAANAALETENLQLQTKQHTYLNARDTFANWLATRSATDQASQNSELIIRTQALDNLKADEQASELIVANSQKDKLAASQNLTAAQTLYSQLLASSQKKWAVSQHHEELRVFGIRLSLTLPLLVLAGFLFSKNRKGKYWPFVWGFCGFALFTFFVELVPYIPSYGGYVRYGVGVLLVLVLGRYLIHALQTYLATQRIKEQLPEPERHKNVDYDLAQKRLTQGICPSCERPIKLNDASGNFCKDCGICLFDHCDHCHARKNAFAHFCHHCGEPGSVG